MSKDSTVKTITVAAVLCLVCSILVATAAVKLRPLREKNQRLDIQKNLLLAANVLDKNNVSESAIIDGFSKVQGLVIEFATGDVAGQYQADSFDQAKARSDAALGIDIPRDKDLAGLKRRSRFGKVYKIKENGVVTQIVLPISGKGLWSTLYGFLSLAPDTKTIKGIGFYKHGETPGLGGEIENPSWQAIWTGKIALNDQFVPQIDVIKGTVDSSNSKADHQIDGLSGATITSRGVEQLINYWLGDNGYGPYLANLRKERGM